MGDGGSIPGLGKSPGEGNGNPLQYPCLENSMDRRSLAGYSPWGHKESDMIEWLHFHLSLSRSKRQLNMCICFYLYVCMEVYVYILWLKFISKLWGAEAQREVKRVPWGYTASKGLLHDLHQGRCVFQSSSCCQVSAESMIQNGCLSSRSLENFPVGPIPECYKHICYVTLKRVLLASFWTCWLWSYAERVCLSCLLWSALCIVMSNSYLLKNQI